MNAFPAPGHVPTESRYALHHKMHNHILHLHMYPVCLGGTRWNKCETSLSITRYSKFLYRIKARRVIVFSIPCVPSRCPDLTMHRLTDDPWLICLHFAPRPTTFEKHFQTVLGLETLVACGAKKHRKPWADCLLATRNKKITVHVEWDGFEGIF